MVGIPQQSLLLLATVIGPLLTLELWGILEAKQAYRRLQARRRRARERCVSPDSGGVAARTGGWAADHPGVTRFTLIALVLVVAVVTEGGISTRVLTLVAAPVGLTIVVLA